MKELPVFDLGEFLQCKQRQANHLQPPVRSEPEELQSDDTVAHLEPRMMQLCSNLAICLRDAGALIVRDPRCSTEDNEEFLDMMERYFSQDYNIKLKNERPELHYQVGVTPEGRELPRCTVDPKLQEEIKQQPVENKARMPTGADPKWRYMWRVGPRPDHTKFKELNAAPVVPEGFPDWMDVMNRWGGKMIAAVEVVAEMAAIGFGIPSDAFISLMHEGPHLLAPTGSDLSCHHEKGKVFAGYHYDLNFLTIHGRSRFPGLNIWLSNGRKVPVAVPEGCLLLQSGKQLEWLTGGVCKAGMHEVVASERTLEAVEAAKEEGRSLWRVSSTVFGHIASDAMLQPLAHFRHAPMAASYPPISAGDFVEAELAVISLRKCSSAGFETSQPANEHTQPNANSSQSSNSSLQGLSQSCLVAG